jgi:hypothetical protein
LRGDKDDLQRSVDDLERATAAEKPPADAFRSLGLVEKQRVNAPAAVRAFEKYLALSPGASDAGLVREYLAEMKP